MWILRGHTFSLYYQPPKKVKFWAKAGLLFQGQGPGKIWDPGMGWKHLDLCLEKFESLGFPELPKSTEVAYYSLVTANTASLLKDYE